LVARDMRRKGQLMTKTDVNKSIVLRQWYQELWNKWNIGVADELLTADYRLRLSGVPAPFDREGAKQVVSMFSTTFPDLQHTVDEMIGDGDAIAARWTVRGTHRGDFQGIAATGNAVQLSGTTIHHMSGGKIDETWLTFDNLDLLQQLGAAVHRPARA